MLFLANPAWRCCAWTRWLSSGSSWARLREPARSAHAHPGLQRRGAHRRAGPAVQVRGHRPPDEVVKYIRPDECQLSYNPLLMAMLWEHAGDARGQAAARSLRERFKPAAGCTWVNYVRCHDDIGWTFADEDAGLGININGFLHRQLPQRLLHRALPGSFARGLPFQENPKTGDARISGTAPRWPGWRRRCARDRPLRPTWRSGASC
jgi:amylosucrase